MLHHSLKLWQDIVRRDHPRTDTASVLRTYDGQDGALNNVNALIYRTKIEKSLHVQVGIAEIL